LPFGAVLGLFVRRERLPPIPTSPWNVPLKAPALSSIAATPASSAAITPAAYTLRFRPSFVDVQSPSIKFSAVEFGNCAIGVRVTAHLHESKASGLPGIAVGHELDGFNSAVLFEQRSNLVLRGLEAEVPHKNLFHLVSFGAAELIGQDRTRIS